MPVVTLPEGSCCAMQKLTSMFPTRPVHTPGTPLTSAFVAVKSWLSTSICDNTWFVGIFSAAFWYTTCTTTGMVMDACAVIWFWCVAIHCCTMVSYCCRCAARFGSCACSICSLAVMPHVRCVVVITFFCPLLYVFCVNAETATVNERTERRSFFIRQEIGVLVCVG